MLYQNALHLTRVHCATFYQNALRHKQRKHEEVRWVRACIVRCSLRLRVFFVANFLKYVRLEFKTRRSLSDDYDG